MGSSVPLKGGGGGAALPRARGMSAIEATEDDAVAQLVRGSSAGEHVVGQMLAIKVLIEAEHVSSRGEGGAAGRATGAAERWLAPQEAPRPPSALAGYGAGEGGRVNWHDEPQCEEWWKVAGGGSEGGPEVCTEPARQEHDEELAEKGERAVAGVASVCGWRGKSCRLGG